MAQLNEVFLFAPLFNFTVADVAREMALIPKEEAITVLLNSPGGEVAAGWTFAGLMADRDGPVNLRVLGHAVSMAAMFPLFATTTTALDVTSFMIHKAQFDGFREPTEAENDLVDKINKDLFTKLKSKIDIAKFKEITGFSLKQIFAEGDRIDVWLTAKEAKDIGLIDKIEKLEAVSAEALNTQIAAHYSSSLVAQVDDANPANPKNINKKDIPPMDINKFKAEHKDIYDQVFALGLTQGVNQEKDRSGAWMKFVEVDAKAVATGIESGDNLTQTAMADFTMKMMATAQKGQIVDDSADTVDTPDAPDGDGKQPDPKVVAFGDALDKSLGLKKETK